MSVPTMEELVETYWVAFNRGEEQERAVKDDEIFDDIRAGLLAVLDRLKPVVAEGRTRARYEDDSREGALQVDLAYATRIIDQIKGA